MAPPNGLGGGMNAVGGAAKGEGDGCSAGETGGTGVGGGVAKCGSGAGAGVGANGAGSVGGAVGGGANVVCGRGAAASGSGGESDPPGALDSLRTGKVCAHFEQRTDTPLTPIFSSARRKRVWQ